MDEFRKLGLAEETIKALEKKGFEKPSPIQSKTIPVLLEGKFDVIGKAQTGTGKTACFALPILENVTNHAGHVQAIVLAPTRELAIQVANEIDSLKGDRNLTVGTIYGGASMRDQLSMLKRGVDIVVGTPGRVMDMMNRGSLNISKISYAVLDEADEMLNMGFVEDIQMILSKTNPDKKMLFFSATMPKQILKIAQKFMREFVVLEVEHENLTCDNVTQLYYDVNNKDKFSTLRRIIAMSKGFYGIVFCKTKAAADSLIRHLQEENLSAAALHGDISQAQREKILTQFRNKFVTILVATDVAARGIDVNDLTHVINYSMPQSPELYVHRIGRTGRAGREGTAITFLSPSEKRGLRQLERVAKTTIKRGSIPSVEDVIDAKKVHIIDLIDGIMKDGKCDEFHDVSEMMLADKSPQKVLAAVLKFAFKNELNHENYKQVRAIKADEVSGRGGRGRSGDRGGRRGGSSDGRRGGSFSGRRGSSDGRSRGGSFGSRDRKEGGNRPRTGGDGRSRSSGEGRSRDGNRSGGRSSERSGERSSGRFERRSPRSGGEGRSPRSEGGRSFRK